MSGIETIRKIRETEPRLPIIFRDRLCFPVRAATAIVLTFITQFDLENVQSFGFLFARTLLLLCVIVFYSILLDALDGIRRQTALAEQGAVQEQLLHLQKRQYE